MEDLMNATEVKIHLDTCSFYQTNSGSTTAKWHNADSLPEAESIAKTISEKYNKGWKKAECCLRFA